MRVRKQIIVKSRREGDAPLHILISDDVYIKGGNEESHAEIYKRVRKILDNLQAQGINWREMETEELKRILSKL